MILIGANVASEIAKSRGDQAVLTWLDHQPLSTVWLSSTSLMELHYGLELLEPGRKKTELSAALSRLKSITFANRIAAFDAAAAEIAGQLAATRRRRGLNIDYRDTQIASIALARRATLITRNIRHFSDLDIDVIDPWTFEG
jgi:predicted nucleic acid-binding protein